MKQPFTKTLLLAIAAIFMFSNSAISQRLAALDNYRIPLKVKSANIGKIIMPESGLEISRQWRFRIINDTADIFRINSKGELSLKRGKSLNPGEPFRYSLTISAKQQGGGRESKKMEFELVKDEFLKNIVVAHRGAWRESSAPQNSLKALENAINIGCSWSEFDLWMSADGVPICNHDPSFKGYMVEDTDASVLTSLELSPGERLPTVEEYIKRAMSQNKTGLVVEIKPSGKSPERTLELTDKVVHLVHSLKAQAWVTYISFSYECLLRVMELDPTAKTAYLGSNKTVEEISKSGMWGVDFNMSLFKKDPLLVKKAKELGLTVNVWTVNAEEDLKLMMDMGVDYITTNEPELLFRLIERL
jgi:glycerophosphoryl diester phosphodiesterase